MSLHKSAGTYIPASSLQSAFSQHVQHLLHVSPEERAILAARLQAELAELRQRESLYVQKRKELTDLEVSFRKRMDGRVDLETTYKAKAKRNQSVLDDLHRQTQDQQAIIDTNTADNGSLSGQVQEKEERVAEREAEIRAVRE
jgi:exonuclease VII large subunit